MNLKHKIYAFFYINSCNLLIKNKIIAKNKRHLREIIEREIKKYGNNCNLNHIDVSHINDMSSLFHNSEFDGDISGWDTSNVENMESMFAYSKFNGSINDWNTSKVRIMSYMFEKSIYNGDISQWDVSKVEEMLYMFHVSKFNHDTTKWSPMSLKNLVGMFLNCQAPEPYWAKINNFEERQEAIEVYKCKKQLEKKINNTLLAKSVFKV